MSILPKNEPNKVDLTPRVFIFRGTAMSGKTYQSVRFPSPILINTDGNCTKVETPSIYLNDKSLSTYKQKLETLFGALKELNETTTEYKTIVIDLIEDIFDICEGYVLEKYKVENLSKVPGYATGYTERRKLMLDVISALKTLSNKYYIVYITHTIDKVVNDRMETIPMLKEEFYDKLEGKSDMVLQCKKLGKSYIVKTVSNRHDYKSDAVKTKCSDKSILEVIKDYE